MQNRDPFIYNELGELRSESVETDIPFQTAAHNKVPHTPSQPVGSNTDSPATLLTQRDWKKAGIDPTNFQSYFHHRTVDNEKVLICKVCYPNYDVPDFKVLKGCRKGIFGAEACSTTSQKRHAASHSLVNTNTPQSTAPVTTQPKISNYLSGHQKKEVRASRAELVTAFTHENLPLSLIESQFMKPFFADKKALSGITNRKQLRQCIMETAAELKSQFLSDIASCPVCLCIDGGTIMGQTFMNVVLTVSRAQRKLFSGPPSRARSG